MDGIIRAGNWVVGQNVSNQFSYGDDLFLTRGRHDLKVGIQFNRHQTNDFTFAAGDGRYNFDSVQQLVTGRPDEWDGKIPADQPIRGNRQWVFGFYVQDDFKWKPNFTVNLGVRYEPIQTPYEVNGLQPNLLDPLNDTVADIYTDKPYFKNPSKLNFAPRIGFAWDPFSDGKTSVRMGYGIFHATLMPYTYTNQIRRSPPFAQQPRIRDDATLAAQFPNAPIEALSASALSDFQAAEFNPSQPYMQQWNLSLQQEVALGVTVTVAYVGSKGTHLQMQRNINASEAEILPDGRKLFRTGVAADRNPNFADIDYWEFSSDSSYHGLNFGANKRFAQGLQFQVSYTYGKSMDLASRANFSDIQENSGKNPQDGYNKGPSNKAPSAHDTAHNFVFNYVYEFPVQGLSGVAGVLLQGWQMNGILSLNTGNPVHLRRGDGAMSDWDRDREASSNTGRVSLAPGGNINPIRADGRDPDAYLDVSNFILHQPGFYGDLGRNTVSGPGISTFDFSLFKNTVLAEDVTLQFRAEFFNIFNRTNFGRIENRIFSSARTYRR